MEVFTSKKTIAVIMVDSEYPEVLKSRRNSREGSGKRCNIQGSHQVLGKCGWVPNACLGNELVIMLFVIENGIFVEPWSGSNDMH